MNSISVWTLIRRSKPHILNHHIVASINHEVSQLTVYRRQTTDFNVIRPVKCYGLQFCSITYLSGTFRFMSITNANLRTRSNLTKTYPSSLRTILSRFPTIPEASSSSIKSTTIDTNSVNLNEQNPVPGVA